MTKRRSYLVKGYVMLSHLSTLIPTSISSVTRLHRVEKKSSVADEGDQDQHVSSRAKQHGEDEENGSDDDRGGMQRREEGQFLPEGSVRRVRWVKCTVTTTHVLAHRGAEDCLDRTSWTASAPAVDTSEANGRITTSAYGITSCCYVPTHVCVIASDGGSLGRHTTSHQLNHR
ncbi:hypothetical protein Bbelb_173260 [Branchiostoma belcheri]|nr:hypothetical protein Bbelb_173260 [Branchiostoma belcheri]